jgi:hypothetical protein
VCWHGVTGRSVCVCCGGGPTCHTVQGQHSSRPAPHSATRQHHTAAPCGCRTDMQGACRTGAQGQQQQFPGSARARMAREQAAARFELRQRPFLPAVLTSVHLRLRLSLDCCHPLPAGTDRKDPSYARTFPLFALIPAAAVLTSVRLRLCPPFLHLLHPLPAGTGRRTPRMRASSRCLFR